MSGLGTRLSPLRPLDLRWRCDPASLGFDTTEHVQPLDAFVGQERAVSAIDLAIRITAPDYNVFVAGAAGSGRTIVTVDLLQRAALARPASSDWCYLHNFREPDRPIAIELPAGMGRELAADLDELIERCRAELPGLIEADDGKHAPDAGIGPSAVGGRLEALRRKYALVPGVVRHVDAIQGELIERIGSSRAADARSGAVPPIWTRFEANVFVTHDRGA